MFELRYIKTGEIYKVYGVRHDNNSLLDVRTMILIYSWNGWTWDNIKKYEPIE